jgi:hypothetical protein
MSSLVSNSRVVSATSHTLEATSQLQNVLHHLPQVVSSVELNTTSHDKEDKWLSTIKESGETRTCHNLHINCAKQRISHSKCHGVLLCILKVFDSAVLVMSRFYQHIFRNKGEDDNAPSQNWLMSSGGADDVLRAVNRGVSCRV